MRLNVHMMQGVSLEAQALVLRRPDETPEAVAARARDEFLIDAHAKRTSRRVQAMTEDTLAQFAAIVHDVMLEQARTGEARYVTAYTRGGEEVFRSEGQITLLGRNTDITCLVEVLDDARLSR